MRRVEFLFRVIIFPPCRPGEAGQLPIWAGNFTLRFRVTCNGIEPRKKRFFPAKQGSQSLHGRARSQGVTGRNPASSAGLGPSSVFPQAGTSLSLYKQQGGSRPPERAMPGRRTDWMVEPDRTHSTDFAREAQTDQLDVTGLNVLTCQSIAHHTAQALVLPMCPA